MTFPTRLKAFREQGGLTREQLAQCLQVPTEQVEAWESGAEEPTASQLVALADALGTDAGTLLLSGGLILFGFPVPIILALLINELHWKKYKRVIQTVSYLPHFISLVVICSLITEFTNSDGVINQVLAMFGVEPTTWLMRPELFKPLFIVSDIWQHAGWSSIVYLAALSAIDPGLYEAATIDGAGRFKQLLHVTLPALIPTITILFIMRIGNVMSLGYEKVILLYNSTTMETADVIASFAYRKGILDMDYGFSTAVGLFNSVVNFGFLWLANTFSKKMTENSLW